MKSKEREREIVFLRLYYSRSTMSCDDSRSTPTCSEERRERERTDKLRLRTRQDKLWHFHLGLKILPKSTINSFFEVTTLFGLMIRLASHKFV